MRKPLAILLVAADAIISNSQPKKSNKNPSRASDCNKLARFLHSVSLPLLFFGQICLLMMLHPLSGWPIRSRPSSPTTSDFFREQGLHTLQRASNLHRFNEANSTVQRPPASVSRISQSFIHCSRSSGGHNKRVGDLSHSWRPHQGRLVERGAEGSPIHPSSL